MNFSNFASFVRAETKTNSSSFPSSDLTLYGNIAKDYLAEEIVQLKEDYFDMVLTTSLVAGQRQYSFPTYMLKNMKMVEAKLDGTNWKRLKEFDLNSYRLRQSKPVKPYNDLDINTSFATATTDETQITNVFSDDTPSFDIDGLTMNIYTESAITSVTNGIKLHATIYPTDYADSDWGTTNEISARKTTTSTALPRPSHEVLARKVIMLFKEANQIPLNEFDLNFPNELEIMKQKLRNTNMDRVYSPRVPRDTGFDY